MAANKAENKVRVTKLFGVSHPLGVIDPKVGMQVKHGVDTLYISALDSGNFQVSLSNLATGVAVRKAYPHDLMCHINVATGTYSYPTGDGAHAFGHSQGILAGGSPLIPGSGAAYLGGDSVIHVFSMGGI